jgi:long-chain acyl-CoA synthetase
VVDPDGADVAILSYTSGTTGRPKGAMNTHLNIANNAEVWRVWAGIGDSDVVAALAPLFHITGPPGITGVAFTAALPIVLTHRFDAATVLAAIERHRCTFTLASITAFLALMNCPGIHTRDLSSFRKVFSGGAPVAPATVARWRRLTGGYIHNCFGLTETNSPTIMVPLGTEAPVDEATGALSIGLPTPGTFVRVVDPDTREEVAPGAEGEFWIRGPGVVPGYWERPEATASAMADGYFRSGDIGKRDAQGWFYAIDRAKDMIIASGFKVWPREVEDLLYQHPDIREAAVIGVPDDYRGETVKAFVSLREGASATAAEIIEFCRHRIAAYKYPRLVEIVDEVPKTATGKFLRRELRDRETANSGRGKAKTVR